MSLMPVVKFRILGLLSAVIALLYPCYCHAQDLPDELQPYDMVIRNSEHFTVKYPKKTEAYAVKSLNYAEYVYGILSQKLNATVDNIIIELFDRDDKYLDYPTIDIEDRFTIYLWPPENILEYPYYGGWLEEQIASHVARILIQRTYSGIAHYGNNLILPPWYLDGMSNLYTFPNHPGLPGHQGLIRAIVRCAAQNQSLPDFNTVMSGYDTWLGNSVSEVYGSAFLSDIAAQYGLEKLTEWNTLNGSNYALVNTNAETVFGKGWRDLYQEWVEKKQASYPPLRQNKQLLTKPYLHERPQVIPEKHAVSYVRDDGLRPKAIVRHDLGSNKEETVIECKGRCAHHWGNRGETLYYTTIVKESHYASETLYALDSGSGIPRKLQIPGHVRCFAENNGVIIAVTVLNNQPQIYKLDTIGDNKHAELMYTAPELSIIEDITAVRDDLWVASYYDPDTNQFDLILITDKYDLVDIQKITDSAEPEMYPFVMQDNQIGYITENAGFYYLNQISMDGTNHHRIHIHDTVMIQPVQGLDGTVYYTDISEAGMSIGALEPSDFSNPKKHISAMPDDESAVDYLEKSVPPAESDYDDGFDWSVWIPDVYLPTFGTSDTSGWYLGVYLANDDTLNHHLYEADFAWYFGGNVFDLDLFYQWNRYQWWLAFSAGVEQEIYIVDTGDDYHNYPLTTYWASIETGTDYHLPLLDIELSFELLAEHTKTNDHSMDELFDTWLRDAGDEKTDLHHRWTNAVVANLKLSHIHDAPKTMPGKTGYRFEYQMRFEPPFFRNYTYSFINQFRLDMSWCMPWRMVDVFSLSLRYGVAATGKPYRYPLEVLTGSGFDFNYFGFDELVAFHGIRSGNLLANNHLIYGHLEYSLPVVVFHHKYLYIPLSFNRIGVGVLGDWAVKSDQLDTVDFSSSIFGAGAEIYLDMTMLYRYPVRVKFGYERGFAKAGENAYYLWIGVL